MRPLIAASTPVAAKEEEVDGRVAVQESLNAVSWSAEVSDVVGNFHVFGK